LRILFGPQDDHRHIDPDAPGGYEWWYFDALSMDGRYALVAIFFLGSPMSPYYKAVVDGRQPLPRDWSGVFFALHEIVGGRWKERAYAYNLYREGDFGGPQPAVSLGTSKMRTAGWERSRQWQLEIDEPGLWRGRTRASLSFSTVGASPMGVAATQPDSAHTWVCVAPDCKVEGTVMLASGEEIDFAGTGYHDHNFGQLPWSDAKIWYWGRAHFAETSAVKTAVLYHLVPPAASDTAQTTLLLYDQRGEPIALPSSVEVTLPRTVRNAYGFEHATLCEWQGGGAALAVDHGIFAEGPFYRRLPVEITVGGDTAWGIGEVFQPARLCGPIASRAMWTRMRRRS
jgi:carotenoid 1,2-hydratase